MLSLLKSIIISSLSLDESLNKSFNNSEFISHHNSGNHTYIVKENQFMNRNYTNEFYIDNNHLLIINSTNYNDP